MLWQLECGLYSVKDEYGKFTLVCVSKETAKMYIEYVSKFGLYN